MTWRCIDLARYKEKDFHFIEETANGLHTVVVFNGGDLQMLFLFPLQQAVVFLILLNIFQHVETEMTECAAAQPLPTNPFRSVPKQKAKTFWHLSDPSRWS